MKAIVHDRYGPPDVLRVEEVDQPVPGQGEVLVQVRATTVNRTDCHRRAASPWLWRLFAGPLRPRLRILGSEFPGVVAAAGPAVTGIAVGDQVFGLNPGLLGAHAEYLCVPWGGLIAPKPARVSFEEAAAVCDGALNALACLRRAGVSSGQQVLIYGASGSIGTAAVQLAAWLGAEVTAVCGTKNLDLVRSLGASQVIDYTAEDFTSHGRAYDIIYDAVGKHSFSRCKSSLRPGGIYLSADGWPVRQAGRAAPRSARRGRHISRGHRPALPAGAGSRRGQVRRNPAENGERRPDHQRQPSPVRSVCGVPTDAMLCCSDWRDLSGAFRRARLRGRCGTAVVSSARASGSGAVRGCAFSVLRLSMGRYGFGHTHRVYLRSCSPDLPMSRLLDVLGR